MNKKGFTFTMQYNNNKTSNSSLQIEMTKGLHALYEVKEHNTHRHTQRTVMKVICLSSMKRDRTPNNHHNDE